MKFLHFIIPLLSTTATLGEECGFSKGHGLDSPISVIYNKRNLKCVRCPTAEESVTSLIPPSVTITNSSFDPCAPPTGTLCNGMWCGHANWTCILAKHLDPKDPRCIRSKKAPTRPFPIDRRRQTPSSTASQIPLIIGFTVGGILLAIVVAGIFLGRNQRVEVETSEMMTTPMSLSNSEWQSNGGCGNCRQYENMRVEEASTEDISAIPNQSIPSEDKSISNGNGIDYLLATANDTTSWISQNTYYGLDPSLQNDYSTLRSSRSDDVVVLDDGYTTGGNFIGSPELMSSTRPAETGERSEQMLYTVRNQSPDSNQNIFWGELNTSHPEAVTDDSTKVSSGTTPQFHGLGYIIEDQDLFDLEYPNSSVSHAMQNWHGRLQSDEDDMQIQTNYREADSDFEETQSIRSTNANNEEADIAESLHGESCENMNHVDNLPRSVFKELTTESPFSESGIEVSSNSKESCDAKNTLHHHQTNAKTQLPSSSWNENSKGSTAAASFDKEVNRYQKKKLLRSQNRSKSCTWKSPAAPTHSSSRKLSIPPNCPSSAPDHVRPRTANLTHVFVDVHRNMLSSDEDLLAFNPLPNTTTHRDRSSFSHSSSDGDSINDLRAIDNDAFSNSSLPRPYTSPKRPLGSRSSKLARSHHYRPYEVKPRTVRFSSSGSGEYAIPFGSIVP